MAIEVQLRTHFLLHQFIFTSTHSNGITKRYCAHSMPLAPSFHDISAHAILFNLNTVITRTAGSLLVLHDYALLSSYHASLYD